jgi:hypothetical protein
VKLSVTVLGVEVLAIELAAPAPSADGEGGERAFLAFCAEDNGGPADPNPIVGRVTPEGAALDVECVPTDDRFADWDDFTSDKARRIGF